MIGRRTTWLDRDMAGNRLEATRKGKRNPQDLFKCACGEYVAYRTLPVEGHYCAKCEQRCREIYGHNGRAVRCQRVRWPVRDDARGPI